MDGVSSACEVQTPRPPEMFPEPSVLVELPARGRPTLLLCPRSILSQFLARYPPPWPREPGCGPLEAGGGHPFSLCPQGLGLIVRQILLRLKEDSTVGNPGVEGASATIL